MARVIPFIKRVIGIDPLIALKPDEVPPQSRRESLGGLGRVDERQKEIRRISLETWPATCSKEPLRFTPIRRDRLSARVHKD